MTQLKWKHFLEDSDLGDFYKNIDKKWSPEQIQTAVSNADEGIENVRERLLTECLSELKTESFVNVILTPEGLGKSKMVFKFIEKYGVDRGILLCKSYDQIKNKQKTYRKYNPDKTTVLIIGTERLLKKHGIDEKSFVHCIDPKTKMPYLSFNKTVEAADIKPNIKKKLYDEKKYQDDVADKKIKVDLLLMTEDKFRVEVILNKRFCNELVIADEFNPDFFFHFKVLPANGPTKEIKLMKPEYSSQEAWTNLNVNMYEIPEKFHWDTYFDGKMIILSTEEKVKSYFKYNPHINIIDKRTTYFCEPKVFIYSVKSKLLNQNNKAKLALAGWANGYIVVGNGINSKDNNVSLLGQNKHDDWQNKPIKVLSTVPSPYEVAELRSNIPGLSSEDAITMKMSDTLNQLMGRCCGHRNEVGVEELHVLIPDNQINKILPNLRYVSQVIRTMTDGKNEMERTIHTLTTDIMDYKKHATLYDASLSKRIEDLVKLMYEKGSSIVKKFKTMKFFKWSKELIEKGKSELQKAMDRFHKADSYNSFIKAPCNIYSDLFNMSDISIIQTKIIDMLRNSGINPVLVYQIEQIR